MNSMPSPPEKEKPARPTKAKASPLLVLPANGTTATAEDLRVRLVLILDSHEPPEIDAGGVENAGQAVLQLLVAAQTEARAGGRPLSFTNASAAFRDRVERCRLTDLIGLKPEGVDA